MLSQIHELEEERAAGCVQAHRMWTTVLQQDGARHWKSLLKATLVLQCAVQMFVGLSWKSWAAVTRGRGEI